MVDITADAGGASFRRHLKKPRFWHSFVDKLIGAINGPATCFVREGQLGRYGAPAPLGLLHRRRSCPSETSAIGNAQLRLKLDGVFFPFRRRRACLARILLQLRMVFGIEIFIGLVATERQGVPMEVPPMPPTCVIVRRK